MVLELRPEYKRRAVVYAIVHTRTGWRYIGHTTELYHRLSAHIATLNRGCHSCRNLQAIWKNPEDFHLEIQHEVPLILPDSKKQVTRIEHDLLLTAPNLLNHHPLPKDAPTIAANEPAKGKPFMRAVPPSKELRQLMKRIRNNKL